MTTNISKKIKAVAAELLDNPTHDGESFRRDVLARFPNAPAIELDLLVDLKKAYDSARVELAKAGATEVYGNGTKGVSAGLKACLETGKAIRQLLVQISKTSDDEAADSESIKERRFKAFLGGWQEAAKVDDEIAAEQAAARKNH